jgi:vitamin B12 transporter
MSHTRPWRTVLVACSLLSSAVFSPACFGQAALDPVVVTGTREPQALSRSSADVVVIDATRIRESGADSVEDLLRRAAGVQLARSGGPGQNAGYFIRGMSTSGSLVLVDGVRIGSASLGQAEFEALGLDQIERVEVLRGPASSLYGADGVGGVVQIFTRRGEGSPRITGGLAVGGYRSSQADLGVSGSRGAFDYAVALGREASRGVSAVRPGDGFGVFNPDDDGYIRRSATLRFGYAPIEGHRLGVSLLETRLNVQYDGADFDAAFNADPSPDFRNRLATRVAALDYRGAVNAQWTTTARLSRSVDDSTAGGATPSRFRTTREQATWQNALQLGAGHRLVLAYEHLREAVDADLFAGGLGRRNDAIVVGYAGRFGVDDVQADLRRDDNSAYGGDTTGRIGWSREIVAGLRLRALAGTSFRAPTFNDLYYPFYGVATIRPERGRSVEIGATWESGTTRIAATLYRNRVRDLIGYEPDTDGTRCPPGYFGCAANVQRARLQGASLIASQTWGGLALRLTADLLDAVDTDTGQRLPRRAAHQETLAADYAAGPWRIGGSIVDIGSRPDGGVVLGGYARLDLRTSWAFLPRWRLEARLDNALDHRIEPVRDYQGLGRQAWIGVRYDGSGV